MTAHRLQRRTAVVPFGRPGLLRFGRIDYQDRAGGLVGNGVGDAAEHPSGTRMPLLPTITRSAPILVATRQIASAGSPVAAWTSTGTLARLAIALSSSSNASAGGRSLCSGTPPASRARLPIQACTPSRYEAWRQRHRQAQRLLVQHATPSTSCPRRPTGSCTYDPLAQAAEPRWYRILLYLLSACLYLLSACQGFRVWLDRMSAFTLPGQTWLRAGPKRFPAPPLSPLWRHPHMSSRWSRYRRRSVPDRGGRA